MKRSTKIIIAVIIIILLALFYIASHSRYYVDIGDTDNETREQIKALFQNKSNNTEPTCWLDTETLTCTPEDKCQLYEDSEGVKWCMAK